jgi:nucleoside 2-deoxyribosyltransferase
MSRPHAAAPKVYLAGPLFTDGERAWHGRAKELLAAKGLDVLWPGDLLSDAEVAAAGEKAPDLIFRACRDALEGCDVVVALLDGTQVDDGTAWEIGYAHAMGKPVYGVRTDMRSAGETRHSLVNAMIQGCLAGLSKSVDEIGELVRKAGRPDAPGPEGRKDGGRRGDGT